MSGRLVRRVLQEREVSPQDPAAAASEDELVVEEAASPTRVAARNPFDILDDDDDEAEKDKEYEVDTDQILSYTEQKQSVKEKPNYTVPETNKKSKKKKKGKAEPPFSTKLRHEKSLDSILEDLSIEKKPMENSVHQNDRAAGKEIEANETTVGTSSVLTIDPKHLKAENEMRRIFGSKVVDSLENQRNIPGSSRQVRGVRRASINPRRTLLVSSPSFWPPWDKSMAMDLVETKSGLNYFRYVYDPSVSHVQDLFESAKSANDLNAIAAILAKYPYHPESLLTFADLFKYSGEHQSSSDAVEKCLFALECAWHPLFSPVQGKYQLKYSHDTNKPFFTALFSHMKNLDRRGCHRSALEACKFLLSLDSDDPKGALFCIDYFALRSQQYKWLEQFAEEYQCDNSLWLFPNFSFSLAIARFYLERDAVSENGSDHADKSTAIDLMKQALMLHPLVLSKIVDKAPLKDSSWTQILRNVFFGSAKPGSPSLEHMISIYVERHYIMWRFPELQNLLKDAALLVIESLKQDSREAQDWVCVRKEAFSSEKNEYSHLLVSDFSDTTPSLPPEELRPFMVGPGMVHDMPPVEQEAGPQRIRTPREIAGRNAALVFLESLLPWVDYGDNHHDGNGQNNDD
ncbi:transcription factor 25 [Brachypodium distachyon]|uniref:Transcription factor 25 n=1 Tax=Brachypodium distachyon TaxID=15368 RepID=I1IRT8_BRADI|nr:transcription factor 25 [Brachypodium distachyon]KQJ91014.1 hypothetical protein BRADI_4g35140v3 [Brachypodium distachyon]|eukprot:XP_003578438.1 transcription factor 25 [Brachypodium distachyon]